MSMELLGVLIIQTLFVMIFISKTRCQCHCRGTDAPQEYELKALRAELMACKKNLEVLRQEKPQGVSSR